LPRDELVKRQCDWKPEAFDAFWDAYPRKLNKVRAMRAWDRLRLPESEIPGMMAFLEACKARRECMKARPCETDRPCDGRDETCEIHGACEYYQSRGFNITPPDEFLLDQPWIY